MTLVRPCSDKCPWETIKDNIGRPNGTFIHSFEVTVQDVRRQYSLRRLLHDRRRTGTIALRAKNRSTPEGTEILPKLMVLI